MGGEGEAPGTSARPYRAGLVGALASVLAVLLGAGAIVGVTRARVAPADPPTARFFADSARWAVAKSASGTVTNVQSQVGTRGLAIADALPPTMGAAVRTTFAAHPDAAAWTNTTTILFPDGQHANIPEVFVASAAGIEQPIGAGTIPLPLSYEPALQVLPADPHVGATWSQEGRATYAGLDVLAYRMANTIARADKDCLVVASDARLTATDQGRELGARDYAEHIETTYCPGAWATTTIADSGTTTTVTSAVAQASRADFADPLITEAEPATDAETLLYERNSPFPGTADPLIISADNLAVDLDETSQVASGVVAGSRMAFPIWRLPGEGPVLAAPVLALAEGSLSGRAGGEPGATQRRVVIADTHGMVTALEPRSGFVLWQRRLDRLPMQLAAGPDGRAIAVLDRTGHGRLLDADTGNEIADATIADPVGVAVAAGPTLVLAGASGTVGVTGGGGTAYGSDTGVTAGPVLAAGQVFIGTDEGRVGVLGAAGAVRWMRIDDWRPVEALAAAGERIVAAANGRLTVLDPSLSVIARLADDATTLTVSAPTPADERGLAATDVRITATSTDGTLRVYDGTGAPLRTLQTPIRGPGSIADATQRAAAVSIGDVTWVSGVTGLVRFAGAGR